MDYKVLKKHPANPTWTVGAVIPMEPNDAEAHVRGGFLEVFVPPPVKTPPPQHTAQVGTPPAPKPPLPEEPPPVGRNTRDKF
jgi:hypothetical protein